MDSQLTEQWVQQQRKLHRDVYGHTAAGQCDCSFGQEPLPQTSTIDLHTSTGQCDCSLSPPQETELSAWLHMTDRCNLRCAYCYLPHLPMDMSWETAQAVVDTICRTAVNHGYRRVKLKYAGGEPLLRFAFVADLHRYAQAVARDHGVIIEGVVLSNGTLLTAEMLQEMLSLGLHLMISLDGLGSEHNSQRCYADGHDSAADVMSSVELALAHGLTPGVSVTISGRNANALPDLVAWILEHDVPFGIHFYREHDASQLESDLALEEDRIVAGMLAAYQVIEANLPRHSLLASLVDGANLAVAHRHTCAVGRHYLVFDTEGQISRCQMHMHRPVTTVRAVDPLAHIRTTTSGIQNLSVDEKEGCRSCEWKYWCTGGCPLTTWQATGRYDVQSPNCAIYKRLYPEVLRLERLRLRIGE